MSRNFHTNILIGEDDEDDQELLEEVLKKIDASIEVSFAVSGTEIIFFLEGLPTPKLPCLIILDYNMPKLNGAEILTAIRRYTRYSHIPVIIWSTSNAAAYRNLCIAAGASDYLVKPSSIKLLEEKLQYMLSFCHYEEGS